MNLCTEPYMVIAFFGSGFFFGHVVSVILYKMKRVRRNAVCHTV